MLRKGVKNRVGLLDTVTTFDLLGIVPWSLGVNTWVAVELSVWAIKYSRPFSMTTLKCNLDDFTLTYTWWVRNCPQNQRDNVQGIIFFTYTIFIRTRVNKNKKLDIDIYNSSHESSLPSEIGSQTRIDVSILYYQLYLYFVSLSIGSYNAKISRYILYTSTLVSIWDKLQKSLA